MLFFSAENNTDYINQAYQNKVIFYFHENDLGENSFREGKETTKMHSN